jgi:hypothetical protein
MFTNCKVIIVNEAYTTKTCGMCGIINNNVGSKEIFKCVNSLCKYTMDRDIQAARNIYLRYLTNLTKQKIITSTPNNNNNNNNDDNDNINDNTNDNNSNNIIYNL